MTNDAHMCNAHLIFLTFSATKLQRPFGPKASEQLRKLCVLTRTYFFASISNILGASTNLAISKPTNWPTLVELASKSNTSNQTTQVKSINMRVNLKYQSPHCSRSNQSDVCCAKSSTRQHFVHSPSDHSYPKLSNSIHKKVVKS